MTTDTPGHRQTANRKASKPVAMKDRGKWWRLALLSAVTLIALVPVIASVGLSFRPAAGSTTTSTVTLENFIHVFSQTSTLAWLKNSLIVSIGTAIVSVAVAAPAGYVLSRARNRLVSGYSLLLFLVQSLPIVVSIIPLFVLFARLGLVDNLLGVGMIYVGGTVAVITWMMASYIDSIPISLEQAAWVDGCSVFGGFARIVLRNSLPGVLSTAIFAFLISWNDYLVAIVFLRSDATLTLPLGLQSFFQQNSTDWGSVMAVSVVMMLPPILIFTTLNKFFSVGGVSGALAGK